MPAVSISSTDLSPPALIAERMGLDDLSFRTPDFSGAGGLPGHLMLGPPPFAPFVFDDIVANPFAIQVSQAILGDSFFNGFYCGNTNCPGNQTQPLHRDTGHLWPDLEVAHPAASAADRAAHSVGVKR